MGKNRKPPSRFQQCQAFVEGLLDGSSIRFGRKLTRLEEMAHFWVLVGRNFSVNRCPARAAALAYTTLLALIPLLAVAMSVTSFFLKSEGKEQIEVFIQEMVDRVVPNVLATTNTSMAWSPEENLLAWPSSETNLVAAAEGTNAPVVVVDDARVAAAQKQAAGYIHEFIQNTYSGTLGVTGVIALLLTAIMTITSVENTLNDIWGVSRGRNWFARIANYWTTITLGTFSLAAALLLASGPRFQRTREILTAVPLLEPVISEMLPIVFTGLAFALLYWLLPNTHIQFSAALAGGVLAGAAWHAFNALSFLIASRVVTWSKIYGGLALVPLFMFGLYVVWLIILFGAQFAYAWQNRAAYLQEKLAERIDQRGREFIALRLMTCVGQYFQNGEPAAPVAELSASLGVPSRLSQQIMRTLKTAGLVSEVAGPEQAYLPARPLETITCHDILLAMRTTNGQPLPQDVDPGAYEVLGEFERIQAAERAAAGSVSLLALVTRAQERLQLTAPLEEMESAASVRPAAAPEPKAARKEGTASVDAQSNPPAASSLGTSKAEVTPRPADDVAGGAILEAAASESSSLPEARLPVSSTVIPAKGPATGAPEVFPSADDAALATSSDASPQQPTTDEERTFPL